MWQDLECNCFWSITSRVIHIEPCNLFTMIMCFPVAKIYVVIRIAGFKM